MADEVKTPAPASMEEDTRTRKTVRLRSIAPEVSAANAAAAPAPAAPAPAAAPVADGDDTMTQQVSPELKTEVEELAQKIINGEIVVESTR